MAAEQDSVNDLQDGVIGEFITATLVFDEVSVVPVPATVWPFGSALLGLVMMKKKENLIFFSVRD